MAGTMLLVVILSLEENFGNGEVSHSVKNALVLPRNKYQFEARVTDC